MSAIVCSAMTMPARDRFRLHDAMKKWFTDKDILTRLLGGLDGEKMLGVRNAFEAKYTQPLWSALKAEIGGHFLTAATAWLNAIEDPSRGAEAYTEQDVNEIASEAPKLCEMVDWLFLENEALLCFVAFLDVESIREATKGWGTDDTRLIRAFTTRNKRALARVNIGYRNKYEAPLQKLIEDELGDNSWYSYLAKFLVVQSEQADLMVLDLAMDGPTIDHQALVEFLCARHPKRVRAAKAKWEGFHDESLVDKLADTLSGDMQRLALKMLKGKRDVDDDIVDDSLARKQAHQLHDGALDYIDVLCTNASEQNALCAKYFEEAYDTSLRRAISQEYSGPVKNALLALLQGPAEWYASQLKAAFSGTEVNEKAICRILGAHDKEEIKEIAVKFDKKYNVTLKSMLSEMCKGNYKRLAVAWVDLPDQLEQPTKKIEIPTLENIEKGASQSHTGQLALDNEVSEDDDDFEPDRDVDPASALYKAKVLSWRNKYIKYRDMGKARKANHYQRLLLLHPPLPKGHSLLRGFAAALEEEYKNDTQGDDWTGIWLGTVEASDFEDAGTTKVRAQSWPITQIAPPILLPLSSCDLSAIAQAFFKEWCDVTESMVAEKKVTIKEIKGHWGLNAVARAQPRTYEPAPLASYGAPVAQPVTPAAPPVATPAYPTAQPVVPQATPAYGSNYPSAQPTLPAYPQAYPTPPIYQPPPAIYQPAPQIVVQQQPAVTVMQAPPVVVQQQPMSMYTTYYR